ncbi:MAG: hypothetical protein ACYC61_32730 [Isosphaeraceae bacterium]
MPLADEIRGLGDRIVARLEEAREFYVHSRQAWRLLQKLASRGRPIGIVDLATRRPLPIGDLDSRVERYVTVRLAESTFRELSTLLEDWILGLIRLWLTAYPEDLDLNFDPATGQRRGKKQEEVQVPLSRLLHLRDCAPILDGLIERTVRDLTYERPEKWFRYIENRVSLGCPDRSETARLFEMKAARDCLEHNQGVINRDYLEKAGTAARFAEGAPVRIDEPYLMGCFALLRGVVEAMAAAAAGIASGPKPARPSHRGKSRGRPSTP